jgi:hypothetical protein
MTASVNGAKSYAHMVDEATWATLPNTPEYYFVPLDTNGLIQQQEFEQATPFAGLLQAVHKQLIYAQVAGQIGMGLFGWYPSGRDESLAETMLKWAFEDQEDSTPRSKWCEWAEGPNVSNGASSGLCCNSATLTGSAESGSIGLSMDMLGKVETAVVTAQTLPDDMEKLLRFLFRDAVLELDLGLTGTYTAASFMGFTWTVGRNLAPVKENSVSPTEISANGQFTETFQFTLRKTAATYDTIRRNLTAEKEFAARLTLKGLHNGTGDAETNYNKVVITFPRLSFTTQEKPGDKGRLSDVVTATVLKPQTSANGHTMAFSDVA